MATNKPFAFGHSKEEITEAFHSKEMLPVINGKVVPGKTTLDVLSTSSSELLKENKDFLEAISKL